MSTLTSKQRKDQTGWFWNYPAVSWHKIGKAFEEIRKGEILWDTVWVRDTIKIDFVGSEQAYVLLMALSWPPLVQLKVFSALWGLSMNEGGNRTGSILKAGLHLGPDCGLWAICPVNHKRYFHQECIFAFLLNSQRSPWISVKIKGHSGQPNIFFRPIRLRRTWSDGKMLIFGSSVTYFAIIHTTVAFSLNLQKLWNVHPISCITGFPIST